MKITEDIRKYTAEQRLTADAALEQALNEKATAFPATGAEIYSKA